MGKKNKAKDDGFQRIVYMDGLNGIVYRNLYDQYLGRLTKVDMKDWLILEGTAEHELLCDVFWSIYQFRVTDSKTRLYPFNRDVLGKLFAMPQFLKLREKTVNRMAICQQVAPQLFRQLLSDEDLRDKVKEQDENGGEGDGEGNEEEQENGQPQGGDGGEQEGNEGDNQQEGKGNGQPQQGKQKSQPQQRKAQKPKMTEQQKRDLAKAIAQAIGEAIKKAIKKAEEAENTAIAWGLGDGDPSKINYADIEKLDNLTDKFGKQLGRLVGRLKEAALNAVTTQDLIQGYTPRDVVYTKDFARILPSQLAMLHEDNPLREQYLDQYDRIGLLGWEKLDTAEESGDFILSIDESGSMGGEANLWAKAVTLALANIAYSQQRRFILSAFSSYGSKLRQVTSNDPLEDRVKWFQTFNGGGTNFNDPVQWFNRTLKKNVEERNLRAPDLVLITDGEGEVSEQYATELRILINHLGARLLVVYIGQSDSEDLNNLADYTLRLRQMDEESAQIFAEEASKLLLTRRHRKVALDTP